MKHYRDSEWLKLKEKLRDTPKQENVIVTAKELQWAIARMSNWKAAGPDYVQGFWFKKATSLHPTFVNARQVPTWMTNCLPSTNVETVDKYILRANVWTFE